MARLNLTIKDSLLKEFREKAVEKFSKERGFTKGALKQATEEAISDWLKKVGKTKKKDREAAAAVETKGSP